MLTCCAVLIPATYLSSPIEAATDIPACVGESWCFFPAHVLTTLWTPEHTDRFVYIPLTGPSCFSPLADPMSTFAQLVKPEQRIAVLICIIPHREYSESASEHILDHGASTIRRLSLHQAQTRDSAGVSRPSLLSPMDRRVHRSTYSPRRPNRSRKASVFPTLTTSTRATSSSRSRSTSRRMRRR
jgi:hypothetical protein